MIRFALLYIVFYGALFLMPLACSQASELVTRAIEPIDPPDTGIALQHRLGASSDSAPKGRTIDSLGLLNCPDLKPPSHP